MSLSTRYNPKEVEEKWYQHWLERNYFHSEPDDREPYTIVIPPPNVTGVLHMGHMLNNTIQDILIRKARLDGKNACWVPGTDHASIATEAKVVKMLREKGIKKSDISRDQFLDYAFEWKDKYGGIILDQLKKLGASCDWKRTRFTMEEKMSDAVLHIFVDLYKKGKVYRGKRMTNWDPEALTVLSNEEVLYKEENSRLFHVRYQVEGTDDEWLTIATTRPETILGDTAIAVHPDDERYQHLKGKRVIVPVAERSIPIIFDKYVEMEFGTGALKVTPAHDMNDYDIGERHHLEVIDVFNDDRTMSEAAGFYVGEDAFVVRKKIVKDLEERGHLVKVEDYRNKVGRSERTNAVVEPRLTLQWFLKMDGFAKTALEAVKNKEVRFFPEHFFNMFYSWLNEDNIRDWCISRQLWWGQRIPAWYYEEEVFVAKTAEEALEQARQKTGNPDLQIADLKQDEDVVDTWFSSWLWPISVFDGFENQDELRYYYPTNVLVTAWDIIFFWVARMIMAGYEWSEELLGKDFVEQNGRQPFHDVYFTGMVRDNQRRKMSKSLGNSPDALALIDTYGADGVRFGMLSSGSAGNDIIFDAPIDPETKKVLNESKLCEQGRNFCNKMWNALRLVKGWERTSEKETGPEAAIHSLAVSWLENKFQQVLKGLDKNYQDYRLSEGLINLYSFIWNDFCSWYLEMVKPAYGKPVQQDIYEETISLFERLMTVLQPFMPFVTEEIWHQLKDRAAGDDCVISSYPAIGDFDEGLIAKVEKAKDLVSKIRDLRNQNGIKMKEELKLFVEDKPSARDLFELDGLEPMVLKMANLSSIDFAAEKPEGALSFSSGTEKYFLEVNMEIDTEAEKAKILPEIERLTKFAGGIEKKLGNERFVQNAPPAVVEREQKKLADTQARLKILEERLSNLD
jgi:valyl-tRNA synthetase